MAVFKSVLLAGILLLTSSFLPQDRVSCSGFLPENDMEIPEHSDQHFGPKQKAGGITEQEFNRVLDIIERLYKDEIRARGGNLVINRQWKKGTVNANARRSGNDWILNMFGGLARHEEITSDGFALVACHELGHQIGGAVKMKLIFPWATIEGSADYWAVTKCLRHVFSLDNNFNELEGAKLETIAVSACRENFATREDRLICARSMLAAQSVAGLFKDLNWNWSRAKFSTPDGGKVLWTKSSHPGTQCRLDTFFQGAICNVDKSEPVDDEDYHVGTCTAKTHKVGLRPTCWFSPDE